MSKRKQATVVWNRIQRRYHQPTLTDVAHVVATTNSIDSDSENVTNMCLLLQCNLDRGGAKR